MQPEPVYRPQEPQVEESHGARKIIGIVLIGLGAIIAVAILQTIYQLLTDGTQFPLIQELSGEPPVIRTPNGDIVLPDNVLILAGYGIVVILIAIAAGIARAFLQIGAQLLQVDIRTLVRQLREEFTRVGSSPPPSVPGARP
jgi:hypothetical protein